MHRLLITFCIYYCIHLHTLYASRVYDMKTKNKVVTFRVAGRVYSELRRVSEATGISVSDLVRLCVQCELPKVREKYADI